MASSTFWFQQALSIGRPSLSKRLSPFASSIRQLGSSRQQSVALKKRWYSADATSQVEPPEYLSEGERKIFDMIRDGLQPTKLEVQDISGGCGSMYALDIVSSHFSGLPVIKQHRMVNNVLGEEIKKWHGVQLKTKAS